jgi:ubiquinone/menaquinone biosynthesis C-methylase UbiE
MPDVYARTAELDDATQARLIDVLEKRAADPRQQAMRRHFLADLPVRVGGRVLDVGCGTGALTRLLAGWPGIGEVVGLDPAPAFLAKAREHTRDLPHVAFQEGDGRALPFDGSAFDIVVFDSVLSHISEPDRALAEAFRVLRPGGVLGAFDGDYATTTVALGDHDPLQACANATMANSVTDRWVVRRLPALARGCGFEDARFRSHGFVETAGEGYMLTVVDRGADILYAARQIGSDTAKALKAEARRRLSEGTFFGHIAYGSLIARKPA